MNVLLIGPPGSGKGTQASIMSLKYGLANISTGEILRSEVKSSSDIGKEAQSFIISGSLVPDEIVIKIIKKRISASDCENGFILDGFPRTIDQVFAMNKMLELDKKTIDIVFLFDASEDVIISRLEKRLYCKKCRAVTGSVDTFSPCSSCGSISGFDVREDDKADIIRARIKNDKLSSVDVRVYYQKYFKNTFLIDAAKDPQEISLQMDCAVQNLTKIRGKIG